MIEAKPYKLLNQIQHYDWGTKNERAFIPKLIGIEPEKDLPYAELWIGAHPKASSKMELGKNIVELEKLIDEFPNAILGKEIALKYSNKLPYLLKVLSCEKALSIQAHPDKKLAKILHTKDSKNYPDENHKPEIAVAIDNLKAIIGFKPIDEFKSIIKKYSALENLLVLNSINDAYIIRQYYSKVMSLSNSELKTIIQKLFNQISNSKNKTAEENIFLKEYDNYGNDVGLISILLFNFIELNKGEGIFTSAGIPHAYLEGNIIECMANSDNVIRAGLTPKYKDVSTLLDMLDFSGKIPNKIKPEGEERLYRTQADEFELKIISYDQNKEIIYKSNNIITGLLLDGKVSINHDDSKHIFTKGEAFLIPAILNKFGIQTLAKSEIVIVNIP